MSRGNNGGRSFIHASPCRPVKTGLRGRPGSDVNRQRADLQRHFVSPSFRFGEKSVEHRWGTLGMEEKASDVECLPRRTSKRRPKGSGEAEQAARQDSQANCRNEV